MKTAFRALVIALVACAASARIALPGSSRSLLTDFRAARQQRVLARRPNVLPLAYAIPGDGVAETVLVGGTLNFLSIYNALVTARILLSWFPQAQGIAALRPLYLVTDPFLNLFRGLGLQFAGIDFSVLPAFFLLSQSQSALVALSADDVPSRFAVPPPPGVAARAQPDRRGALQPAAAATARSPTLGFVASSAGGLREAVRGPRVFS